MRPREDWILPVHTLRPLDGWPRLLRVAGETVYAHQSYAQAGAERSHAGRLLLKCTLAGQGEYLYDGTAMAVPAGHAFLTWVNDPRMVYRYPPAAREPWRFVYAAFTCEASMADSLLTRHGRVLPTPVDGPVVRRLLKQRRPSAGSLDLDAASSAQFVMDLLADLARAAELQAGVAEGAAMRLVSRARELVEQGRPQVPAVAELAAALGVSREVLGRAFRSVLGRSPQSYLAAWHMEQAALLLADGQLPVMAIASALGFDTTSHFARAFRRCFGVTPGAYRHGGASSMLPAGPAPP